MAIACKPAPTIEIRDLPIRHVATVRESIRIERLPTELERIFESVMEAIGTQGLAPSGAPFARFRHAHRVIDLEAGIPLAQPIEASGEVRPSLLPGGPAACASHVGDYRNVGHTHLKLHNFLLSHAMRPKGAPWERYVADATTTADHTKWLTELVQPIYRH